jgi:uncharacterized membrane protein
MALVLVIASLVWPVVLGTALWLRTDHRAPLATALVYAAASPICHQRDERSFHTHGAKWPVCARCSALYLSAPAGAIAAFGRRRRPGAGHRVSRRVLGWLIAASVPTVLTLVLEWLNLAPMTNPIRAASAVPLGAMVAFVLVRTSRVEVL